MLVCGECMCLLHFMCGNDLIQNVVYDHVDQVLSNADWLVSRLKIELTTPTSADESSGTL